MTEGDGGRRNRITKALDEAHLDALICVLPSDVLLLTGYWPVVGASVAVATRGGPFRVLVPADEEELADQGWAAVIPYNPGSLTSLELPAERLLSPLASLAEQLGFVSGSIGFESRATFEPSSYSATYRLQSQIRTLLQMALPEAEILPADDTIALLRSRLTQPEVSCLALSCQIAQSGYNVARSRVRIGATEAEIATAVSATVERKALSHQEVTRGGAFAWCMSGKNSSLAGGAFARSTGRPIQAGDLVLVHSNPFINGYFGDITRTYVLGEPDNRQAEMYRAILAAREASLSAIRPGVACAEVDSAARTVIDKAGFGQYFTHGLGHPLGFTAISADFPPRLHPASGDCLDIGATFNLEPSIYIPNYGGIRHCDVVTLAQEGPIVLTQFHQAMAELIVSI